MRVRFHPSARIEYIEAARYYEKQQVGLGSRFLKNVESVLRGIADSPESWPMLEGEIRRRMVRVFPYTILYAVRPTSVFIVAVMHTHRNPDYWKERVE